MRVLSVAAEAMPLAKEGGLADVTGALAWALRSRGSDTRVLLPAYGTTLEQLRSEGRDPTPVRRLRIPWRGGSREVRILREELTHDVPAYLVEDEEYFGSRGIYRDPATGEYYRDRGERWALLAAAAASFARGYRWRPDIVHLHDHHTGLFPYLLASERLPGTLPDPRPGLIFTIHNIAYQGVYPPALLDILPLGPSLSDPEGPLLKEGRLNMMQAGIEGCDRITTVSPTYAEEIQTPEQGAGLHDVIRRWAPDVRGILNGIDTEVWDPASDPHIAATYTADDLEGKRRCRADLREEMDLPDDRGERVLVGLVSRLAEQKGWDLLGPALPRALGLPIDFVILGTGLEKFEEMVRELAGRWPDRVGARIGFDEGLAHRIEAGADAFLMPSRFEPCGLNQLYSLRYGTLPVARRTGGLADTVIDLDSGEDGNGFLFERYAADALLDALGRMCRAWEEPARWRAAVKGAMAADHSWERSASEYLELFEELLSSQR
ncbi:MAG: glycogen synthase GlgA [bacterium]